MTISPIEMMVDKATGASSGTQQPSLITLTCPKCSRSRRVRPIGIDPISAESMEYPCLDCGNEGWDCPKYYDGDGNRIEFPTGPGMTRADAKPEHEADAELRRSLEEYKGVGVKVKTLEWDGRGDDVQIAQSPIGAWFAIKNIYGDIYHKLSSYENVPAGSIPEAKAAAQSDFERRVMECLENQKGAEA